MADGAASQVIDHGPLRAEAFAAGARLWAPAAGGRPVLTLPVASDGETLDIVAFDPASADAPRLRLGVVDVLGDLDGPVVRSGRAVVRLHGDVLSWLRGRGCGCVVLDWKALTPARLAECILVCDDGPHALAVRRALDGVWRRHRTLRPLLRVLGSRKSEGGGVRCDNGEPRP